MFDRPDVHPLLKALWQPRLIEAIRWIAAEVASDLAAGRKILAVGIEGRAEIAGVTLTGKADRIDLLPDGKRGIVANNELKSVVKGRRVSGRVEQCVSGRIKKKQ